jgi:hypothetical protein
MRPQAPLLRLVIAAGALRWIENHGTVSVTSFSDLVADGRVIQGTPTRVADTAKVLLGHRVTIKNAVILAGRAVQFGILKEDLILSVWKEA